MISEYYQQGYEARNRNLGTMCCPYTMPEPAVHGFNNEAGHLQESRRFIEWMAGWNDADRGM